MSTDPTNGTPHDHAKPQAPEGGRDSHGRFAEGNGGGPGNPFARQVAALRSALLARVTPQDVGDVAAALLRQAKEGNVAAAKLLLSYTLGKPAQAVDPDTLDLHEFELYRRRPDPAAEMAAAPRRLALEVGLDYLRAVVPPLVEEQRRQIVQGIRAQEAEEQREAAARAKARQRRAAQKAAPASPAPSAGAPQAPAVDEKALALVGRLLGLTPPSANGTPGRPGGLTPPSANGRSDFKG